MPARKKSGRGRSGAAEDAEARSALDELYVTPPVDFVARRDALAAAAKEAGRADDARRIRGARRPTLAAWATNLLVRSRPQESREFLALGTALREAHGTMDRGRLRELSAQQWRIIAALSQLASRLARGSGQRLSAPVQREVESTLRAVLADPEAADRWAAGHLEAPLTPPPSFPPAAASVASVAAEPVADELADRRRQRKERAARARKEAAAAERALRARRKEQSSAETSLRRAQDRREHAEQRVRQAREDLRHADEEHQQAEARRRTAEEAAEAAEREAEAAARKAERSRASRKK